MGSQYKVPVKTKQKCSYMMCTLQMHNDVNILYLETHSIVRNPRKDHTDKLRDLSTFKVKIFIPQ